MQLISEDQVREVLDMNFAIANITQTYKDCVAGKIYAGNRLFMPVRGQDSVGQWLVANCTDKDYFGSKFSAVFPSNLAIGLPSTISKISLYSATTGELKALIDANYLTAIKTGGSAAIATDLMAAPNATKLAVIGSGLQAFSQVLAIQEVRTLEALYIYDLNADRVATFSEQIKQIQNRPYQIIAAKSADDCVANADIICTCTTSKAPVFNGNSLKPGTHINAIGSFTSFMQEIDTETVIKSSKVITEHTEGLWEVAGDILIPFAEGKINKEKVTGTVGEALTGKIKCRESAEEITLYESVGSGVLDIALAIAVYEKVIEI